MFKDKTDKFGTGLNKGIQLFQSDFGLDLAFLVDTYNVSSGINEGLGPRYGFSVLPGHNTDDLPGGSTTFGLHVSRSNIFTSRTLIYRNSFTKIYALPVGSPSDFTTPVTQYFFLVSTSDYASSTALRVMQLASNSTYSAPLSTPSKYFYEGLQKSGEDTYGWDVELIKGTTADGKGTPCYQARTTSQPGVINWQSSAFISVTGPDNVGDWLVAQCISDGAVATIPNCAFIPFQANAAAANPYWTYCAAPAEWNLRTFPATTRNIDLYTFNNTAVNTGQFNIKYRTTGFPPTTGYGRQSRYGASSNQITNAGTTVKLTAGVTYTSNDIAVLNDKQAKINSSYKAIFLAFGKAFGYIIQDWAINVSGTYTQHFDPTLNAFSPGVFSTMESAGGGGSYYTEDGSPVMSSFEAWPIYSSSAALVAGTYGPELGAINTGLLRNATTYEFTYSVFNKRLNFETNVGSPVKFRTGANDFVSLIISRNTSNPENGYSRKLAANIRDIMPYPAGTDVSQISALNLNLNDMEYRFYYRPLGSYEWLPALFISAVQYWFEPFRPTLVACATAIAGLPGGQPGGFSDYSPLNSDNYTCVLTYKDRVFWFSDRAIRFSIARNVFAYPQRNSVGANAGAFRGGLVHNYPGQADQSSRLVVFTTDTVYVGRFDGQPQIMPIQVAPISYGGDPVVNNFPVDGSDFVLDAWTSNTAFSFRSAVVAEGLLYWWGPKGIFRDDGVQTPTKISKDLEPNIFSLADPQFSTSVHAYYNSLTKEILWFYTPVGGSVTFTPVAGYRMENQTKAIVYNVEDETFTFATFDEPIDNVFDLDVNWQDNDMTGIPGSGRAIAAKRTQTLPAETGYPELYAYQLGYFFDKNNRSGDLRAQRQLMAIDVTYPTVGNAKLVRFTVDNGYVMSSVTVGDIIALEANQIATGYGTALNAIGTVTAKDNVARTVDVTFDTDNVITPITPGAVAIKYRFCVYDASFNGIAWKMTTAYWMPKGVNYWANWLYAFFLFKFNKWLGTAPTITVSHRTPVSGSADVDTMTLSDNSDGNCQIYHPLTVGDMSWEGQALKLVLSGTHIGHEWVLQYLEAHAMPLDGDQLKIFEG